VKSDAKCCTVCKWRHRCRTPTPTASLWRRNVANPAIYWRRMIRRKPKSSSTPFHVQWWRTAAVSSWSSCARAIYPNQPAWSKLAFLCCSFATNCICVMTNAWVVRFLTYLLIKRSLVGKLGMQAISGWFSVSRLPVDTRPLQITEFKIHVSIRHASMTSMHTRTNTFRILCGLRSQGSMIIKKECQLLAVVESFMELSEGCRNTSVASPKIWRA